MALFIIFGVVVLVAIAIPTFLFFILEKESKKEDAQAVPLKDLSPFIPKTVKEPEIIPAFVLKAPLPVPLPVQSPKYLAGEDTYKKRSQELEEELLAISKKADDQLKQSQQMIEDLTQENEALKNQQASLVQAQQKVVELQTQTDTLHTENSTLQVRLDESSVKVRFMEEEIASVKIQMGEEIARANAMVSQLNLEKESWGMDASRLSQVDLLNQELEALKTKQIQLEQNYADLEKADQRLREINMDLTQKVDLLQYELVKARAQTTGLERIGFNYKNQLEDFFKKINEVQLTNEKLSEELKVRAS